MKPIYKLLQRTKTQFWFGGFLRFFLGLALLMHLSETQAQTTYTFTNCAATGRSGPTQTQVNAAYSGTSLAGAVTINTQGIQEWTVPVTGNYSTTIIKR